MKLCYDYDMKMEIVEGRELVPFRRPLPVEQPRFSKERQQPYIDADFEVIETKRLSEVRRELGALPLTQNRNAGYSQTYEDMLAGGAFSKALYEKLDRLRKEAMTQGETNRLSWWQVLLLILVGMIGNAAAESLQPLPDSGRSESDPI